MQKDYIMTVEGPSWGPGWQLPPGGYPTDQAGMGDAQGNAPPPPGYPPPTAPPNYGQFADAPQRGPDRRGQFRQGGARAAEASARAAEAGAQFAGKVGEWLNNAAKRILTPEKAVASGGNVLQVYQQYGLNPSDIDGLEVLAAEGPKARKQATEAVLSPYMQGDIVGQVAYNQFGIRNPQNVMRLRWHVANNLLDQGIPPYVALTKCGLPEAALEELTEIALSGPGRQAMQQDYVAPSMIPSIARTLGLDGDPKHVLRLTGYAAAHQWKLEAQRAAAYSMRPPPFEPVASHYGLNPDVLRTVLACESIEQSESVESVMHRLALPPDTRMQFEAYAVEKGPVGSLAGEPQVHVWSLARQYGISDPLGSGLEGAILRGPVGDAVRRDLQAHVPIEDISRMSGLTQAAIRAVKGDSLNEIMIDPSLPPARLEHARAQLARIILDGPAGEVLRAGADISVIVKNYGIDESTVVAYTQRMQYRQP